MRFSRFLTSAVNNIGNMPPESAAAAAGAGLAFLLALVLLGGTLDNAAAGMQLLATSVGGLIAAFIASRLAAYLVRVTRLWAGWPLLSRGRQLAVALLLALMAAAAVLAIMLLLS